METDKATVEMEAYTNGTIRKLIATEGQFVKVGEPDRHHRRRRRGHLGARCRRPAPPAPAAAPAPAPAPAPAAAAAAGRRAAAAAARPAADRPQPEGLAARAADGRRSRRRLGSLQGTGPQGRIIKRDIEAALAPAPRRRAGRQAGCRSGRGRCRWWRRREGGPGVQDVELSPMRRTIAKRLVQSKGPVPHFYLTIDVAMDRVWDAYKALRDQKSTISINDIIVKATALALRQHPEINASFAGDHIKRLHPGAHRHGRGARGRADHAGPPRRRPEAARGDLRRGAEPGRARPRAASCSRTSTPARPSRSRTSA